MPLSHGTKGRRIGNQKPGSPGTGIQYVSLAADHNRPFHNPLLDVVTEAPAPDAGGTGHRRFDILSFLMGSYG